MTATVEPSTRRRIHRAPFAAALMERFGVRLVAPGAGPGERGDDRATLFMSDGAYRVLAWRIGTPDLYRVSEYTDIGRPGLVASWAEDAFR